MAASFVGDLPVEGVHAVIRPSTTNMKRSTLSLLGKPQDRHAYRPQIADAMRSSVTDQESACWPPKL